MRLGAVVANLVSALRLVLTPFAGLAILDGRFGIALLVFIAAGSTDVIDGYLARRFGGVSRFGAYLDPISDKVLLSTVYLCFAFAGAAPWWLVAIVFGRDVLILLLAGAMLVFTKIRSFTPSAWGKASTFVQIVTAVAVMVDRAAPAPWLGQAATALIWLAAAVTTWSGLHYAWRGIRVVRGH